MRIVGIDGLGDDTVIRGSRKTGKQVINIDKVKSDVARLKAQVSPTAQPQVLANVANQLLARAEKAADVVAEEVIVILASIVRDFGDKFDYAKSVAREALDKLASKGEISAKEELASLT